MLQMLALMVFGHALADYPLQGQFLAKAKNRAHPVEGVPWYQPMGAHAVIHGGVVGLATGSLVLAAAEAVCHFVIDDQKCMGRIGYNPDQALHILCKLAWAGAIWALGPIP